LTPDEDFILDQHPKHHNIIIGAGFSGVLFVDQYWYIYIIMCFCVGHGFKLAPVVGKILAELTLGLPSSHNLQPFKLSRLL